MTHIPDEAVQAAEAQFTEYFLKNYPKDCIIYNPAWHAPKIFRAAKAAITENTPNLHAPCAVEVNKLDWLDDISQVKSLGLCYTISLDDGHTEHGDAGWYVLEESTNTAISGHDWSPEQAKAAAQADFERRILSCAVTKPVDVAAVRRQAEHAHAMYSPLVTIVSLLGNVDHSIGNGANSARMRGELLNEIKAIAERALSDEPAQGEQSDRTALAQGGVNDE